MKIEHARHGALALVGTYIVYNHTWNITLISTGALWHYIYVNRDKMKSIYDECIFTWHEMNPQHPKGIHMYRIIDTSKENN